MKVIGKDRTSCDVCNPIDEILARLDALERRASAIVAKVQGIAPDGEGNVTLPTSSSDTDPLHGRVDAFAMSSEVKEAADDAHAYAASIADDVVVINSEIDALNQAVEALQPAEIEAIKSAVQTLQTTVATLESTVATLNNSVAGKVSKSGDTMTGELLIQKSNSGYPLKLEYTTYNSGLLIKRTSTPIDSEITGSSNGAKLYFQDAGDVSYAGVITQKEIGYNTISLANYKAGVSTKLISLFSYSDGTAYAVAPSWSVGTNDNSDKILTIKMANSLPSLVHTTGNETINGIKTFNTSPVVPSTSSDARGNEIATAGWVISKINEVATKNGLAGL